MILTGKALEDFTKWEITNDYVYVTTYDKSHNILENALIIEWFDSVGIIILPKRFTHKLEFSDWYFIITNKQGVHLNNYLEDRVNVDSRQEAIEKAIIKANKIYNENIRTN